MRKLNKRSDNLIRPFIYVQGDDDHVYRRQILYARHSIPDSRLLAKHTVVHDRNNGSPAQG